MKKLLSATALLSLSLCCGSLTSCVPLAVGAVGGYIIADEGIRLQSPVTKNKKEPEYQY